MLKFVIKISLVMINICVISNLLSKDITNEWKIAVERSCSLATKELQTFMKTNKLVFNENYIKKTKRLLMDSRSFNTEEKQWLLKTKTLRYFFISCFLNRVYCSEVLQWQKSKTKSELEKSAKKLKKKISIPLGKELKIIIKYLDSTKSKKIKKELYPIILRDLRFIGNYNQVLKYIAWIELNDRKNYIKTYKYIALEEARRNKIKFNKIIVGHFPENGLITKDAITVCWKYSCSRERNQVNDIIDMKININKKQKVFSIAGLPTGNYTIYIKTKNGDKLAHDLSLTESPHLIPNLTSWVMP